MHINLHGDFPFNCLKKHHRLKIQTFTSIKFLNCGTKEYDYNIYEILS
jgi:hypothetical protein